MIFPLALGATGGMLLCMLVALVEGLLSGGRTTVALDAWWVFLLGGAVLLWWRCEMEG